MSKKNRLNHADGRQRLIDATLLCLGERGSNQLSVREIARAADVTASLVTHYFTGKNELIAAACEYASSAYMTRLQEQLVKSNDTPRQQLAQFIHASLYDHTMHSNHLRVWMGFWNEAMINPVVNELQQKSHELYLAWLTELLAKYLPVEGRTQERTQALIELAEQVSHSIDGCWLNHCLYPQQHDVSVSERGIWCLIDNFTST